MPVKSPSYVEQGYSGDFGLTGLTEQLCSADHSAADLATDLPAALAVVARSADGSDGEEAVELGEDARRLLDSPLSEGDLHTVWLALGGAARTTPPDP
ncbi:hypothetical protein ABT085_41075, partial [Streptomyces sp. NPDC002265]